MAPASKQDESAVEEKKKKGTPVVRGLKKGLGNKTPPEKTAEQKAAEEAERKE